MPSFDSIKDLEKHINKKIASALKNEVAEKVKDVMQDKVETEVYNAYTSHSDHPDKYVRRGEKGGLKSRSNMKESVTDTTLTVENTTKMKDTGYELAGLVEYGNDKGYGEYDYYPAKNSEGDFRKPRPFIDETKKSIESTGEHINAMRKGLKRQGIDLE